MSRQLREGGRESAEVRAQASERGSRGWGTEDQSGMRESGVGKL